MSKKDKGDITRMTSFQQAIEQNFEFAICQTTTTPTHFCEKYQTVACDSHREVIGKHFVHFSPTFKAVFDSCAKSYSTICSHQLQSQNKWKMARDYSQTPPLLVREGPPREIQSLAKRVLRLYFHFGCQMAANASISAESVPAYVMMSNSSAATWHARTPSIRISLGLM